MGTNEWLSAFPLPDGHSGLVLLAPYGGGVDTQRRSRWSTLRIGREGGLGDVAWAGLGRFIPRSLSSGLWPKPTKLEVPDGQETQGDHIGAILACRHHRRSKAESYSCTPHVRFIEMFYNHKRLHSSLDYLTPVEYEANIHHHKAAHAA